ncbi:MAG: zinc ribbon domain-containing protein [Planctomycetaceae bacterium]|jgi:putative FmdB family regulatory protein|nr:zinc ribbon domain-containing protein [Planctomycetaceae bacterium]
MPSYEYKCDACGHEFEEFQGIKDAPLRKCPQCKKNKLRRLISGGAAIVFKGSGFYQTDYRSEKYKKAASAESANANNNANSNANAAENSANAKAASATAQAAQKHSAADNNSKKETQKNNSTKTKE